MADIEVSDLVKRYGDHTAVDGVGFRVERGEIFGIVGPNGAGKTTTVECVEGLRTPDAGTVRVCGLDPRRDEAELRHVLGVQLQEAELPDRLTVAEALRCYGSFHRHPADTSELVEVLGLGSRWRTQFRRLSGGQRQRLSIALALVGNPRVVVLDELTTGLDPQARRDVWDLVERVRDRGVTVLLVTHFMAEAERLCDRLAVIDRGRVVATGSPAGLVDQVDDRQRVRFRPSGEFSPTLLRGSPEVVSVEEVGNHLVVTGTGNLLLALTGELARHGVTATELRVEQATLDDAFVALTHRPADS